MTEENSIVDDFDEDDKVVSGNFFKFEKEEDSIIGQLTAITDGTYGKQYVLLVEGEEIIVGSYSALAGNILEEDISKKIKIVYKGEKKSKNGRNYKEFEVFKK